MDITEPIISQCLNELNTTALTKQKYLDYYNGNHAILKDYAMQESRSNRKLIFPLYYGATITVSTIHISSLSMKWFLYMLSFHMSFPFRYPKTNTHFLSI